MVSPNDDVANGVVPHAQLDGNLRLRAVLVQTRQRAEVLGGNRRSVLLADERVRIRRIAWRNREEGGR